MRRLFAAILLSLIPSISHSSALSDLAQSMSPNSWAWLHQTPTYQNGLLVSAKTPGTCTVTGYPDLAYLTEVWYDSVCGSMVSFTWNMAYDPTGKRVYIAAGEHSNNYGRLIWYDINTDKWYPQGGPDRTNLAGHSYGNQMFLTSQRKYSRGRGDRDLYSVTDNTWSYMGFPYPTCNIPEYEVPQAYISNRDELFFASWHGGAWRYRFVTPVGYEQVGRGYYCGSGSLPWAMTAQKNGVGAYNPRSGVFIWGGGGGDTGPPTNNPLWLYKYDSSGNISRVGDMPYQMSGRFVQFVPDPTSGDFFAFLPLQSGESSCRAYRYNPTTDTWSTFTFNNQMLWANGGYCGQARYSTVGDPEFEKVAAVPIDDLGVILWLDTSKSKSYPRVYVYKPPSATLTVGPGKQYSTISAAISAAGTYATILVDAGTYNETLTINKSLTIRSVGGKATVNGPVTNGKGIVLISTGNTSWINVTLDGLIITGASGGNGNEGGIRAEQKTNVTVMNSVIHGNMEGIATSNDNASSLIVQNCDIYNNGWNSYPYVGYVTHGMYVGNISYFKIEGSYVHGNNYGHNIKSRAQNNYILYNRIMDESNGIAAWQIDLPWGGESYIIGNVIHKNNSVHGNYYVIAYNEEGRSNTSQALYVVNNTIVSEREVNNQFVYQRYGQATTLMQNNILIGTGSKFTGSGTLTDTANLGPQTVDPGFVSMAAYDYNLTSLATSVINTGTPPGTSPTGVSLNPTYSYVHPVSTTARTVSGTTIDRGAYEFYGTIDTTPPSINNTSNTPSGTYPSSTTSLLVEWGTNENSTCKYDTRPNILYTSMLLQDGPMSLTGALLHNRTKTGMTPGSAYTYYVRCIDASGNANQLDHTISWSIQAVYPSAPVVQGVLTGGASFTGGQIQ